MNPINIPELPRNCNSWIVKRITTGEVIGEFFNRDSLLRFNGDKCIVLTTLAHLQSLDKK